MSTGILRNFTATSARVVTKDNFKIGDRLTILIKFKEGTLEKSVLVIDTSLIGMICLLMFENLTNAEEEYINSKIG